MTRIGATFRAVEMVEVSCADCGMDATVAHDLGQPDGVPRLASIDDAEWMLPSRGWTRAPDLEPAGAAPADQAWRCSPCTRPSPKDNTVSLSTEGRA